MKDKPADQPTTNTSERFNDEKYHYQTLITLFKWTYGAAAAGLTILLAVGGFIFYSNGKDMKEAVQRQQDEVNAQLKEMKSELRERESELDQRVSSLGVANDQKIRNLSNDALARVGSVRDEARGMAQSEAKKRVTQVFEDRNIESTIEQIAKEKLTPRISQIVEQQAGLFRSYADEVAMVRSAKTFVELYRVGQIVKSPKAKQKAKDALAEMRQKEKEPLKLYSEMSKDSVESVKYLENYWGGFIGSADKRIEIIDETYNTAMGMYTGITSDHNWLIIEAFYQMSLLTGKQIPMLDFEALTRVYRDFKKQPYRLRYIDRVK